MFAAALAFAALAAPGAADEAAELGAKVFRKNCFACHKVGEGARHLVGPVLNDLIGRSAGSVGDFARYSRPMKAAGESGLVWTEEALRDYLPAPRDYVTGTTMTFVGLKKPEEIDALIAYLKQFSPDVEPAATPEERGIGISTY